MPETEETVAFRVNLGRINFVQEFTDILLDLDRAYNAVYYFLDLSRDIEDFHRSWVGLWPVWPAVAWFPPATRIPGRRRRFQLTPPVIAGEEDFSTFVLPSERLVLKACQISSPGWMDILGKLNPLTILREYHEIRKDREYREKAEKEKLHLENELLRNRVIRQRIDILKELGLPRSAIKEIINSVLKEPINGFLRHVDNGDIRELTKMPPSSREGETRK